MKNQAKRLLSVLLAVIMLLSVIPVVNGFAAGNSMADATNISTGRTYSGSITSFNDKDFYRVTIGSSGRLTLTATAGMEYIYYCIYDSSGKELWGGRQDWNSTTEIITTKKSLDLTKGTYYFAVEDYGYTGNYSFKFDFVSAGESFTETGWGTDNRISDANTISLSTKYNGQIAENDEKDLYKFVLPSSGRLTLNASAKMNYIYYCIYDFSGKELWGGRQDWNSTTEIITTKKSLDLTKGTYYFAVEDYGYTGNYSFKFDFVSAGESFTEMGWGTDNKISDANTINLDTKYKGQLAENDEKDFYKFVLPSSKKITFTASAKMNYIYYCIYDSSGKELWGGRQDWNSNTETITTSESLNLPKGTYYLAVKEYGYTGNYSFSISTHTHKYTNAVTKATTSSDGKIVNRCSCGIVKSQSAIPKVSSISLSKTTFTYNGKIQRPSVVVKDRTGKTLKNGTDYTVKYSSGCKNVGQYTVTVTFKGKYSGTKTLTFKIVPKGTSISKLTAGKKQFTAKWSAQTAQTTGYELQYSTSSSMSGAKKVTVGKNKTTSSTVKKLKGKKQYYVRVRTYKTVKVNGKNVKIYSAWSKTRNIKTK